MLKLRASSQPTAALFIDRYALLFGILIWSLVYLGHYLYMESRGVKVWNFQLTYESMRSVFTVSCAIPLSLFTGFIANRRLFAKPASAERKLKQMSKSKSTIIFSACFILYSLLSYLFIGNYPVLKGAMGESAPGQIILIVLQTLCFAFVQETLKLKFIYDVRVSQIASLFLLLNLLFTSRFYFLSSILAMYSMWAWQQNIVLTRILFVLSAHAKINKKHILGCLIIILSATLLVWYSLKRGSFMTSLDFDVWDILYQRSIEVLPASAENLSAASNCNLLALPAQLFNGIAAFVPNAFRSNFSTINFDSTYYARSIHPSFLEHFVVDYGCLPLTIQFTVLFLIYLSAFFASFYLFSFNCAQSSCKSNLYASSFALFAQMVVLLRSSSYFWTLAFAGFGLIIPWLVRSIPKSL